MKKSKIKIVIKKSILKKYPSGLTNTAYAVLTDVLKEVDKLYNRRKRN